MMVIHLAPVTRRDCSGDSRPRSALRDEQFVRRGFHGDHLPRQAGRQLRPVGLAESVETLTRPGVTSVDRESTLGRMRHRPTLMTEFWKQVDLF